MTERFRQLTDAVRLLASDAKRQLDHLEGLGVPGVIDELALEYDAIATAAADMLEKGQLNKAQSDCVCRLNRLLETMSNNDNCWLWTTEALSSAPEWNQVRGVAAECLALLTVSPERR